MSKWWDETVAELLTNRLTAGNRMMIEGSTATERNGDVEIRGGEIPITSPYVVELIVNETRENRAGALLFPEMPTAKRRKPR